MNKSEFISAVAAEAKLEQKTTAAVLAASEKVLTEALKKGETVAFIGFGTFSCKKREARKGINPATKEQIMIPEAIVPSLKFGKSFKDQL